MTPLEKAQATIKGLEAALSHMRRDEQRAEAHRWANEACKARAYERECKVRERFYECENQHEPLASLVWTDDILSDEYTAQRADIMKALRYVVFGKEI